MRYLNLLILSVNTLCPDYDLGTSDGFILNIKTRFNIQNVPIIINSCVKKCNAMMNECWDNCEGDEVCDYDCSKEGDQCIDACPCFSDCPSGCDGCTSSFCVCSEPEEDPDYIVCAAQAESVYVGCLAGCPAGDTVCVASCSRNYNIMIDQCPCQV